MNGTIGNDSFFNYLFVHVLYIIYKSDIIQIINKYTIKYIGNIMNKSSRVNAELSQSEEDLQE